MTIKLPLQRVTIYGENIVYSSDVAQLEAAYAELNVRNYRLAEDLNVNRLTVRDFEDEQKEFIKSLAELADLVVKLEAERDGLRKKVCELQDSNHRLTNQIHELMRGGIK